jgi:hypothetical protein
LCRLGGSFANGRDAEGFCGGLRGHLRG